MFTYLSHHNINRQLKLALLTFALSLWASQASATFLSLESITTSTNVNQQITVDIWARDLGADVVSGFDIDIAFDPSALSFQSASFSSLLGNGIDSLQDAVDAGNSLNLSELSFLFESDLSALQNGTDFALASLTFVANQVGMTQLSITDSLVTGADPFSAAFAGPGNVLGIDVSAAQVPEPAAYILLILGLVLVSLQGKSSTFPWRGYHEIR